MLLDQFPRNLFRGDRRSFATDDQALALALHAIHQGYDQQLMPVERLFVYLPLEHSENLAHQDQCVALMEQLCATHPEFAAPSTMPIATETSFNALGAFPTATTS